MNRRSLFGKLIGAVVGFKAAPVVVASAEPKLNFLKTSKASMTHIIWERSLPNGAGGWKSLSEEHFPNRP